MGYLTSDFLKVYKRAERDERHKMLGTILEACEGLPSPLV